METSKPTKTPRSRAEVGETCHRQPYICSLRRSGQASIFVDGDPEPPADYLLALTEEAMGESGRDDEEPTVLPPGLAAWLPSSYLAAVVSPYLRWSGPGSTESSC